MEPSNRLVLAMVISLNGQWLLGTDPHNVGRDHEWWKAPTADAKPAKVPWIIQDTFPGYHGVAWYWRDFTAPANPHPQGRTLIRFGAVDYLAEVWLNGVPVGGHEGGEGPFALDVTGAVKPNAENRLAVRVLNPTPEPIDGIVLGETPHRNKAVPYTSGSAWDQGGIVNPVELILAPPVRVEDLFVRPDPKTGLIRVQANLRNALTKPTPAHFEFTVAPATAGVALNFARLERALPAGDTLIEAELRVEQPHLWNLNDPFLYRVTARVDAGGATDEQSVRCGFRDFRFEDGYFRLNGKRLFLRSSHTGNCCPVGLERPVDPDWLRRDLLNVKVMGFNAIRFIAGIPLPEQLDLCDEIGLMVYEESYAGWCLADSPKMPERYDRSTVEMIRRDRNHPSVVIWGLLNETPEGPVLQHAVQALKLVRSLDDTRLVFLNSGRWDVQSGQQLAGLEVWRNEERTDPCVTRNAIDHPLTGLGITWQPGQLAFHPGRNGEYGVVRFTAPAAGGYSVAVRFSSIAEHATTDVHVLHNEAALFDSLINLEGHGAVCDFTKQVTVKRGDTIDFAVGYGNGDYGADTTALAPVIRSADGKTHDGAADFAVAANPNDVWSYGQLAPSPKPKASTFVLFPHGERLGATPVVGTLSNPGSHVWEDVLSDQHTYPRVPHTAGIIHDLRSLSGGRNHVFLSEYGIGSGLDLARLTRHYEQLGATHAEDAQFYRVCLDQFLADWKKWHLDDTFAGPEDYSAQCLAKMAGQRLLGLNAIRANPNLVGHNLTGTVDQGMTGEGLFTTFRELKPGTLDAVFDGFAPLRLCLFAEPVNVYRGTKVRLEAVLADEDALRPGEYPLRLQVVGPNNARVFDRMISVTVPDPKAKPEPPFAMPVFAEDVPVDGPSGRYRFLASFERGAAAAGGETEFYLADPAEMPPVDSEVVLWGEDPGLAKWLADRGIRTRPFAPGAQTKCEVILVSRAPAAPGGAVAFRELATHIARGSTAIFLCPEVFAKGDNPTGWLPLANKGQVTAIGAWLYLADEWAKRHPIFEGLPTGLMDYTYYREIINNTVFAGQDAPTEAVAGAMKTSQAYSSGLLVAVDNLGAGRFILNTLFIHDNLGTHPAAERLLRNMLRYAARDAAQPPADLPADFEAQLKALGY